MKKLLLFILVGVSPMAAQSTTHQLSVHILDVEKGISAAGINVELFRQQRNGEWQSIARGVSSTSPIDNFLRNSPRNIGIYKIRVYSRDYLEAQNRPTIFPYVDVVINIDTDEHYHIPVLLSGNNYTTYRGS